VVAATRGLERGRVAQEQVEQAFGEDLDDLIQLQREAQVDFFSDGLLRWQDVFRPLAEAAGMRPRSLTRWFDNNAFFRAPEVNGSLGPFTVPTSITSPATVPEPRVGTLPSPFMFSRAAVTSLDRNALMQSLAAEVLRPAAEQLAAAGCRVIQLQEPWLGFFGCDAGDWPAIERAVGVLQEGLPAGLLLHVYFGDAAPHLDRLRRLPVHAVGIDLVETDIAALPAPWPIGLLAGCLNGRSSVLESEEQIAAVAKRVAEQVTPKVLYLSASCDLEFLPREVAAQKVRRLGAAARQLRTLVAR
jgi:5-methyltetrahydropteroyltriglutamate--homocysteine methyltransferase